MRFIQWAALLLATMTVIACNSGKSKPVVENKIDNPKHAMDFNADSAYHYVKTQVDFGPRVPGTPGHKACAEYIVDRLSQYGADTILTQQFVATAFNGDKLPLTNIMGRFKPETEKRILLVAHWDTRPWADNDPDLKNRTKPVPGANDGASGAGVLLEIARLVGLKNPAVGVDFLFVDGEDYGRSEGWGASEETWCLGTRYWVNNMPYGSGRLPVYGILFDMVGGKGAKFYREFSSDRYASEINDKVWSVAHASGFRKKFIPQQSGGIVDDHLVINNAGIPCIDIVECNNPDTGTFPPNWHTLEDNMDYIDRESLKAAGQTVVNTIYLEPESTGL